MKGGYKILVISDRLNTSIKKVKEAVKNRNEGYIEELARRQVESGAAMLDVHARENAEDMKWIIPVIRRVTDRPLSIDTDEQDVLEAALEVYEGKALVNSINGEKKRLESFLPLIEEYDADCIALAMGEKGMADSAEGRLEVCRGILKEAENYGIGRERIYFDPLALPVSTRSDYGMLAINTLRLLKEEMGAKTTVGVSNVSHGLPLPTRIEQAFLLMALPYLDSALMDALDEKLMSALRAGEVILGEDKHCRKYIKAYRKGLLK